MNHRRLGWAGLKVPTLCLGTMTFGEADASSFMHKVGCDEATSFAIMDRALEADVNFFDTADIYGQDGLSERIVGAWMAQRNTRHQILLATKFRFRMSPGPNGAGASRYHIMRACEDSLRRLQTDRIDLYQIHMQDMEVDEDELLRALDDLVRQGKVLYIGASNYAAYRLCDSLHTSAGLGLERFCALQAQYSLLHRELEREHVPLCRSKRLGILPWSPLAGGFLTGKYRRQTPPPEGTRLGRWVDSLGRLDRDRSWAIVDALDAVSGELGATPAQVALAWLLARPHVTSVIFGARSLAQLEDNLAAAELELEPAHIEQLTAASDFELGYPYDFMRQVHPEW